MVRLSMHDRDIATLKDTMDKIINRFKKLFWGAEAMSTEQMALTVSFALLETTINLNHIIDAIHRAQSGEFSLPLVHVDGLVTALKSLEQQNAREGRKMAITNVFDLTHLPCSYVYQPETHVLSLIVHIPSSVPSSALTLYEYINMPRLASNDVYLAIEPPAKYFAINGEMTLYTERTDLEDCLKMETSYYCKEDITFKKSRKSCLLSLYENSNDIQDLCETSLVNLNSRAHRLNESHFIVCETQKSDLSISCNKQLIKKQPIHGTYLIKIPAGCIISTDHVIIERPNHEPEIDVDGLIFNEQLQPEDATVQELGELANLSRNLLQTVGSKILTKSVKQLNDFRKEMKRLETETYIDLDDSAISTGGIISSIITYAIITVISIIVYLIVQRFLKKQRSPFSISFKLRKSSRKTSAQDGSSARPDFGISDSVLSTDDETAQETVFGPPQGAAGYSRAKLPVTVI